MPSSESRELIAFIPLSQIQPRPITWLWPERLPLGKLAILDGDPGIGKSLVTLDLCARLTTGRPFPDGPSGLTEPADVVILNAEDSADDTIYPRLRALGGNIDRVHVPKLGQGRLFQPPRFPRDANSLHQVLLATRAKLVILDPVTAFLERRLMTSNDQCVDEALRPLGVLADHHLCTILLVRHLNKSGGLRSLYRGLGSIGFIGTCRSSWLIAADPQEPRRRVLAQVKGSVSDIQPSLAFRIERAESGALTLTWQGASPLSADQLLAGAATAGLKLRPRERATQLLEEFLAGAVRTGDEVWEFMKKNRLAERTVKRAKEDLEIVSRTVYLDGKRTSYWLLPSQELPAHIPPEAVEFDLSALLGRHGQSERRNPLDSM